MKALRLIPAVQRLSMGGSLQSSRCDPETDRLNYEQLLDLNTMVCCFGHCVFTSDMGTAEREVCAMTR